MYRWYAESKNKKAFLAKLCSQATTYLEGAGYTKIGYRLNYISEATYAEIKELSTNLGYKTQIAN